MSLELTVYKVLDAESIRKEYYPEVSEKYFTRKKKEYIFTKLLEDYNLSAEEFVAEGENGKKYYKLRKSAVSKKQMNFDWLKEQGVKITPKKAERWERILKALIVDKVIPVVAEIALQTDLKERTTKEDINEMIELGILERPKGFTRPIADPETGEIIGEEYINPASYTYYLELAKNVRQKIEFDYVHQLYSRTFRQHVEDLQLRFTGKKKMFYSDVKANKAANVVALQTVGEVFGEGKVKTAYRWPNFIIQKEVISQIKSIYK